jgi:hypothetical protein
MGGIFNCDNFSVPTQTQKTSRSEKAEGIKMLGSNEIGI